MTLLIRAMAITLCLLVVFAARAQTDDPADDPQFDHDALSVLEGLATHLQSRKTFAYRSESNYDTLQDSGAMVEFGASRKVLVARPDRLRMESERRDGMHSVVLFNGDNILVYAPDQQAYAMAAQPGDIDESVQFAVTHLRLKAPLANLISPNLYDNVTAKLTGALYLGETVVAGVACDHLLLSNDYTDFQMWITTGDEPVLRRIVITYKEEEGQPQYRAQFLEWDMAPENVEEKFVFEPPEEAERIRFYGEVEASDTETEDES